MSNRPVTIAKLLGLCCLGGLIELPLQLHANNDWDAGLLFDKCVLTLEAGQRTEALGPLFYRQQRDTEHTLAVPPLFSHTTDDATEATEFDFVYPLLTYDRFGGEFRWQLFQLLSFAGGKSQDEESTRRFTVFPLYFQQRSQDPSKNYTALFPIYGHLQNRLYRSEIDFALWPIYVKTVRRPSASALPDDPFLRLPYRYLSARRGDITTYNYFYPFFHLRYGNGLSGWQLWPLVGYEQKQVTQVTNTWGDIETVPGREKQFILWPFWFDEHRNIGSENAEHAQGLIPFYSFLRSSQRDSTSYLWPLGVTVTDDRLKKYREIDAPWPIVVFAQGEGKTAQRVFPFFGRASSTNLESNFYLWPVYKYNRIHSDALDRERTRILFFLYSKVNEKNTKTGATFERTDFLPFFRHRRDFNGNTRLQLFSPLEPILPNSKSIDRNWSPLWSVWRAEKNLKTGDASQSLLWNLYRRDTSDRARKCSLLFGLFQYQSAEKAKRLRLFYIPIGKKPE
jgi:hypothetical protein